MVLQTSWDINGVTVPESVKTWPTSPTGVNLLQPVPTLAAVWLMGSGLIGLTGLARRRKAA